MGARGMLSDNVRKASFVRDANSSPAADWIFGWRHVFILRLLSLAIMEADLCIVQCSLPSSFSVAGKNLQSVTSSVSDRENSQLEILSLQVALVVRVCECRWPHKQTLRSFFRSGLSLSPRPVHSRWT